MPFENILGKSNINVSKPGEYIGKLASLRDAPVSEESLRRFPDAKDQMLWTWELATVQPDGSIKRAIGNDNQPAVFTEYTGVVIGNHAKNKPRPRFEALLKRKVNPGDDAQAIANEALGKIAVLWIGPVLKEDGVNTKLVITMVKPYEGAGSAPPSPPDDDDRLVAAATAFADEDLPF